MIRLARSPDAVVLLASAAAGVLLLSLRGISEVLPSVSFAAALALFVAPGVLLSHWLLGDDLSRVALLPVGFALSTGIFGLLGVPFLISHASIEGYLWASGAVLAVFLGAAARRMFRAGPAAPEGVPGGKLAGSAGFLWVPLALLGGALAFVATRRVPNDNDDIWVYLSWVRGFVDAERLALHNPYYGDATGDLSRVHANGWLLEQAALSRVSGLDPIELVLRHLTPVLVILALLAVYALARGLFASERAGVLCAAVYALFHVVFIEPSVHNIGVELAVRVAEDKHAARFLIMPVALLFAYLFVRRRRWRYLLLFAFSCWTVAVVHPVVLAPLGICMLGFGLLHVAVWPLRRAAWTGMAALALALWSVALGPMLLVFSGESLVGGLYSADINRTPPEALYATVFIAEHWRHIYELGGSSYIMHPWLILNPAILGAYLLGVPFLVWRLKESLVARLLLGGMVLVAAVVYVPPVATFVGEELVGPNLLWRLAWPIPLLALLTAGWMLWRGLEYVGERMSGAGFGRRAVGALPLALLAALTLAVAMPAAKEALRLYQRFEVARTADYHPDPIYPWIRNNIQEPSVLLAPDAESTALPAYSDKVDVVSYRSGAMVRNREELERYAGSGMELPRNYLDSYEFFSDATLEKGDYEVLRRYGVDYLMVRAGGPLAERLQGRRGFTPVYDAPRQDYVLYEVDPGRLKAPG